MKARQNAKPRAVPAGTAVLAALFAASIATTPALAHHSFGAEYDSEKQVTLTGVVTKFEWTNPHARFYVDVKDQKGDVVNWNLELASPNSLVHQGWKRTSLKVGDQVTVNAWLARDGSQLANAKTVILADGTKVGAASDNGGKE